MTHALLHETVGTAGFWWTVVAVVVLAAAGAVYLVFKLARRFFGRGGR